MDYNQILNENNIDAMWVSNFDNKAYLSGFSGSTSEVIIKKNELIFITDGRYQTQAKYELKPGIKLVFATTQASYFQKVIEILDDVKTIGIEADDLSINDYQSLKKQLPQKNLVATSAIFEKLRAIKNQTEIELTKQAIKISEQALLKTFSMFEVGMTEKALLLLLENNQVLLGADKASFETIIASGKNTAKPHARATDKIIKAGEILTIDFGCFKDGYCSDITRTFFINETNNQQLIEVHDIVKQALNLQINALKPGVSCQKIDEIGREFINENGYGEYFLHGTGHGIGRQIHEAPRINQISTEILKSGMIVTIEPGIYIENVGGVRIEQDVLITDEGCEVLTTISDDYNFYNNEAGIK